MGDKKTAIRKRQQIEQTSKTMFTWVAIASVSVAVAAVVSISLVERLVFNQKIIGIKSQTASNLKSNNAIVDELRENVRVRNTDQALLDTPRPKGAQPISVVLDALPSQPNSSALGASLEQKLLNVNNVRIESLVVDATAGEQSNQSTESASQSVSEHAITFKFEVSSRSASDIKKVLQRLEQSIRVINIMSDDIEQNDGTIRMSVVGEGYYAPEVKAELSTISETPGKTTKKSKASTDEKN